MRKITTIFDHAINILAYMAGVLVVFIMLTIGAEIIVRKLLGFSIIWAVEYSEHAILFITFLSVAWLVRKNMHIKIDVLTDSLNPNGQAWLNATTSAIGTALCLFIAYRSAFTVWDVWQRHVYTTTTQEVPMAPLLGVICVGSLLLAIEFSRAAYGHLKTRAVTTVKTKDGRGDI